VDLGFTSYQALRSEIVNALKAGDLVTLARNGQPASAPDAAKADLYTYDAEILRVVDGDTLWLKIWLKAGHWLKEKVRLRGLDCPEISTPEGKAAKQFVERLLQESVSVTITTTKPDKWDRYLSDIFLTMPSPLRGEGGHRQDEVEELFLNNLLLENGHARRYDKVTLGDWEEE
jgi:endonuclease YncB( thermonuclease family)